MRQLVASIVASAMLCSLSSPLFAYTSQGKATISITGSGVTPTQAMTTTIVAQGTGDPGTPTTLSFGSGVNDFRDSGESIRIDVNTNLAGNRIIIYTDNLNATAVPQAQVDTSLGNDGGGLVGVTDRRFIVPMLWALQDSNATNYAFTTATVGDDEIYITDRAHVATYVDAALGTAASSTDKQTLDTLAMKRCDTGAAVPNADNTGAAGDPQRYPQFFGSPGVFDSDLCSGALSAVTITPASGTPVTIQPCTTAPCPANSKIPFSEELSKNIAVAAFSCFGTSCTAPNLATASPSDSITVASPFYLPMAADFRSAPGQDYSTSTLTVELVTQ